MFGGIAETRQNNDRSQLEKRRMKVLQLADQFLWSCDFLSDMIHYKEKRQQFETLRI